MNGKNFELMVIGGSAGSLSVVLKIIPLLTKNMNVGVVIVFHRKAADDTGLIDMLSHRTSFEVREAGDKDEIRAGVIYIAPPDYHVLIEKDKSITLDDSEKVNYSRPSIDVTMESAAEVYGPRLLCVLLSGANADGVEGLVAAMRAGATIVVQDPANAEVSYMPKMAVDRLKPHLLLSDETLTELVSQLTNNN